MGKYHKYLAGSLGVILFMLGAISAEAHDIGDTQEKEISQRHGNPIVIEITEDGFIPNEVSITQGETVIWRNIGRRSHWPASNFHPTHTLYPEKSEDDCLGSSFDACGALQLGESWTFIFSEVGSWRYHDHLFPSLGGIIHVRNNEGEHSEKKYSIALVGLSIFGQHNFFGQFFDFFADFIAQFKKLLDFVEGIDVSDPEAFLISTPEQQEETIMRLSNSSPGRAWEYLKKTAVRNDGVVLNVHGLAHTIGNALYRKKGFEGMQICDPAFSFGCYHGVTEEFLQEKGVKKVPSAAKKCKEVFPARNQFMQYSSCVHGIGHGLLTLREFDLKKALQDCDMLEEGDRSYCYDGVFMEHSFSASKKDLVNTGPWSLCKNLDEKYHINCARYQPSIFSTVFAMSFTEIANTCIEAPTGTLREHCIIAVGFSVAHKTRGDADIILEMCKAIKDNVYKNQCIIAAAEELIFQGYQGWKENAFTLCFVLSGEWQEQCRKRTQNIVELYFSGREVKVPANVFSSKHPPEIVEILKIRDRDAGAKLYRQLIERIGVVEAQEALVRSGLPFTGETHLINHTSGDYVYEKYGTKGLIYCKDYFLASCYHGAVLNAIAKEGINGLVDVMGYCWERGKPVATQCAHAIGHGFLAWVGYKELPAALQKCDQLSRMNRRFPIFNCYDGVFMENLWAVHEDGTPSKDRWIRDSDPYYPCYDENIKEEWKKGCWANQASVMYQMFNGDLRKVSKHCESVEEPEYRKMCYDSLSRQIHPLTNGDVNQAFELCQYLKKEWIDFCLLTIAAADFSVGGRILTYEICANLKGYIKSTCYKTLYQLIKIYSTPFEQAEYCSLIKDMRYRETCERMKL